MNLLTHHKLPRTLLFYLAFAAIFAISFFLHSPYGTIRFSSDHAVHVLMTHDLQLPDDLYYWGQNRLGSLVPVLANLLYRSCVPDAMLATTIVHYGFLLGAALLACRYLKKRLYKLLFLVFWLMPLPLFKEHHMFGHPYAAQTFPLLLGLYFHERRAGSLTGKALLFLSGNLIMFLSFWVSELSACFIGAYYFTIGLRFLANRKTIWLDKRLLLINIVTTLATLLLNVFFISYAKKHASSLGDYEKMFARPIKWIQSMKLHWNDLLQTIAQVSEAPLKGLYAIVFVLILFMLLLLLFRQKLKTFGSFHVLLFFLSGPVTWIFMYSLFWTTYNNSEYKYWTFVVPFIFLFLLMAAERAAVTRRLLTVAFCLLALIQLPLCWEYATKGQRWETDFSYAELRKYKELGNCGLIADYWFSYSLASADPNNIVATPHDRSYVRNQRYIQEVLQKKTIYLVQNRWLEQWPEEITQFGHKLTKSGGPFRIERASFCKYTVAE